VEITRWVVRGTATRRVRGGWDTVRDGHSPAARPTNPCPVHAHVNSIP
jgi:hypothetical protein